VNGYATRAFVDSGSTLSVMSRTYAQHLNINANPKTSINVETVAGLTRSVGRVNINVTIGQISKIIEIHIFDKFNYDLLIGVDDAAKFNIKLDFADRQYTQTINGYERVVNYAEETPTSPYAPNTSQTSL
jgi:hypothetical protein